MNDAANPIYGEDVSMPRANQKSGPLAGHVKDGRVFRSPLAATMILQIGSWERDDLPDLLWPVLTLSELGTSAAREFILWQKAVLLDLNGLAEPRFVAACLDGRLTSLERVAERVPEARDIVKARAYEMGILPDPVVRVLSTYPNRPAEWLTDLDLISPGQEEIDLLFQAVFGVMKDSHRESIIKCFFIWSAVQAGTFSATLGTVELLKDYPTNLKTRDSADSAVRGMWGAHRSLLMHESENQFAAADKWATTFWAINSMTTNCARERDVESDANEDVGLVVETVAANRRPGSPSPGAMPEGGAHLRRLALDLMSSYVEALEMSPSDLHGRERQEVNSGIIARIARDVITALSSPDSWSIEHGAHIIRALVEGRIYIQWMAQQDSEIYKTFQAYGAGKAKLYARIANEVPEEARRPEFITAVEELERLSHNDPTIDFRVVDTRDSFAEGKSLRAMADECGLLDLYRQTYSLASGVAHSEWWSIETHAMERCLNVLHGGHLIPSLSLNFGGNVELASSWVDQLYTAMQMSLRILGTDEYSVRRAFAWLNNDVAEDEGLEDDARPA